MAEKPQVALLFKSAILAITELVVMRQKLAC